MTAGTLIQVRLKAVWVEQAGYRYDVIFDGETIVSGSRDPEYEAARVLHGLGLRGRFRTVDFNTGRPRMVLDIATAAKLRTIERDAGGPPIVGLYRPMSDEEKGRARLHRADQGCVDAERAVPFTLASFQRADGMRGVARSLARAES